MKRKLYDKLLAWKESPYRKPLIIKGARQVGKTYLAEEFGKKEYEDMIVLNCDKDKRIAGIFRSGFQTQKIISDIEILTGKNIIPSKTLLFIDEAGDVPETISSLKYFCEDMPELHVAAAGSLLGISLRNDESYPVGKVNTLNIFPMSFSEFLLAKGRKGLHDVVSELAWDSMKAMNEDLTELLRQYYFTGGMPEAVKKYVETGDVAKVREVQQEILRAYEFDVTKHTKVQGEKIRQVWQSIPAQLARENKKFIFGAVRKGARAATFEEAIQWLIDAGLVYKVARVSKPAAPLKFYADNNAFKLYVLDCGLLACMSEANPNQMLLGMTAFTEFKGSFTENFVIQQLKAAGCQSAYYYSKDNSTMEVDFLFQTDERVVPVEAKAEDNVKSHSLSNFVQNDFAEINLKGLRMSMKPYIDQGWMENIPLYSAESYVKKQIEQ